MDMAYCENVNSENSENSGIRISLIVELLAVALVPLCVITVMLSMMAAVNIRNAMTDEALSRLNATAYSLSDMLNAMDSGDFCLAEDGLLYKGDTLIAGDIDGNAKQIDEMFGEINKSTGFEVAAFWGDELVGSSFSDDSDSVLLNAVEPSEAVCSEVLMQGRDYAATDLSVDGQDFYGYYVPLYQNDGSIVGMAFAGMHEKKIGTAFTVLMGSVVVTAVIIFMMSVFVLAISSKKFIYGYRATVSAVNNQALS